MSLYDKTEMVRMAMRHMQMNPDVGNGYEFKFDERLHKILHPPRDPKWSREIKNVLAGPWHVEMAGSTVYSSDFALDLFLHVSGDFLDGDEKSEVLHAIQRCLNASDSDMVQGFRDLAQEMRDVTVRAPISAGILQYWADRIDNIITHRATKKTEETVWRNIESAPLDNKRPLYLARFSNGKLQEIDFEGEWRSDSESWELPQVYWYWASASGIEDPTHWAYQDEEIPPTSRVEKAPTNIYFIREDHSTVILPNNTSEAMAKIEAEFNGGQTRGALHCKDPYFDIAGAGEAYRLEFLADCQSKLKEILES